MRSDRDAFLDIAFASERAIEYLGERSFDDLSTDLILQDAIMYRLIIIGEATSRISDESKARWPSLPYTLMKAMRNAAAHDYDEIDYFEIWSTVVHDLPPLIRQIQGIIDQIDRDEPLEMHENA